ncbi:MAG: peptide ABC transporter substrate-binding protein [Pyrinomonadaceae bacterium]
MKGRLAKIVRDPPRWRAKLVAVLSLALVASGGGCFLDDAGGSYYGRVVVPRAQEFRWSDGGLPRVFDPARAAAPPDTDAVRALYEGLTDYDPRTLAVVPADAARWEASRDARVWTFYLRDDARWSNGEPVTAQDYLRSWQRTLRLGEDAPHFSLLNNLIAGDARSLRGDTQPKPNDAQSATGSEANANTNATANAPESRVANGATHGESRLAVEALGDHVLRLSLRRPDPNLPALLAHPIFRPVHDAPAAQAGRGEASPAGAPQPNDGVPTPPVAGGALVTNGAFRLGEATDERVVLERAPNYWDAARVALERVRFVGARDAEGALAAYRAGEVDAVTNVNVEPTGLKLLASYKDFRRATFGALTYYDFNATRPPFDDVRVRLALALAIDRGRLSEDTLEGSTVPAENFLPAEPREEKERDAKSEDGPTKADDLRRDEAKSDDAKAGGESKQAAEGDGAAKLTFDPDRARRLLAEAGYPGGYGFPRVRLLVNRNDQHRQVAETIKEMWQDVLGVETDLQLKSWDEYETRLRAGEYDVAKRSLLMQTTDEEANMLAMFSPERFAFGAGGATDAQGAAASPQPAGGAPRRAAAENSPPRVVPEILDEPQALREVPAIPVYFASSFALVKPYVGGFDANLLEAYSLKRVRLDVGWQPPRKEPTAVVGFGRR